MSWKQLFTPGPPGGVSRFVDFDARGLTVRYSDATAPVHMPIDELALITVGVDPERPRRSRRVAWFFDRRGAHTSGAGVNASFDEIAARLSQLPGFDPSRIPAAGAPEQMTDVWRRAEVRCPRCERHALVDASRDPVIATGRRLRPLYACACGRIGQIGFSRLDDARRTLPEATDWTRVVGATVSPMSHVTRARWARFDGFFALRLRDGTRRVVWSDAVAIDEFVGALAARFGVPREAVVDKMLEPGDEIELAGG
jgi:hypothetical protein